MKILIINKFLYPKGGDAVYALNLGKMLESRGHQVVYWGMDHPNNPPYPYRKYFIPYVDYENVRGLMPRVKMSMDILYSFEAKAKLRKVLDAERPDIVHLHNFAHQISPSILHLLKKRKIPSVMTVHDYKLVCASYQLMAGGRICEACTGGKFFNCFAKACVKNSRVKSAVNTVEMYLHHKVLRIYSSIRAIICPSAFMANKLRQMGFKGNIIQMPYFVFKEDAESATSPAATPYLLYFGRLIKEKGVLTLVQALKGSSVKLKIVGDGPIRQDIEKIIQDNHMTNIELAGYKTGTELKEAIRGCTVVVLPSEWHDNFPVSIMEAFSAGKPVIGSDLGGIPELVKEGETGLIFRSGDVEALRNKIESLMSRPEEAERMGQHARTVIEREYGPDWHYERLMKIYQEASQ